MNKLKIPKTFVPESNKRLEEKIKELVKEVEEIKEAGMNCIQSTKCSKYENCNITLKFENGKPTGIICSNYEDNKDSQYCFHEFTRQKCIYAQGFQPIKPVTD